MEEVSNLFNKEQSQMYSVVFYINIDFSYHHALIVSQERESGKCTKT